jgi:hypothetical protein
LICFLFIVQVSFGNFLPSRRPCFTPRRTPPPSDRFIDYICVLQRGPLLPSPSHKASNIATGSVTAAGTGSSAGPSTAIAASAPGIHTLDVHALLGARFRGDVAARYPARDWDKQTELPSALPLFAFAGAFAADGGGHARLMRTMDDDASNFDSSVASAPPDAAPTSSSASSPPLLTSAEIANLAPPPQLHHFVLTTNDGRKQYGTAIVFWEPVHWAELAQLQQEILSSVKPSRGSASTSSSASSVNPSSSSATAAHCSAADTSRYWTPVALCLLSQWPDASIHARVLHQLRRMSISIAHAADADAALSRTLAQLVYEIPAPPRGCMYVHATVGASLHVRLARAPPNEAPPIPVAAPAVEHLFASLDLDKIIHLVTALLTEQKVVLMSRRAHILTPVAETLCALMFPFRWQGVYMPLLPRALWDYCHAPMPFLAGIVLPHDSGSGAGSDSGSSASVGNMSGRRHRRDESDCEFEPPAGVVAVWLDDNRIELVGSAEPELFEWPPLPLKAFQKLLGQLESLAPPQHWRAPKVPTPKHPRFSKMATGGMTAADDAESASFGVSPNRQNNSLSLLSSQSLPVSARGGSATPDSYTVPNSARTLNGGFLTSSTLNLSSAAASAGASLSVLPCKSMPTWTQQFPGASAAAMTPVVGSLKPIPVEALWESACCASVHQQNDSRHLQTSIAHSTSGGGGFFVELSTAAAPAPTVRRGSISSSIDSFVTSLFGSSSKDAAEKEKEKEIERRVRSRSLSVSTTAASSTSSTTLTSSLPPISLSDSYPALSLLSSASPPSWTSIAAWSDFDDQFAAESGLPSHPMSSHANSALPPIDTAQISAAFVRVFCGLLMPYRAFLNLAGVEAAPTVGANIGGSANGNSSGGASSSSAPSSALSSAPVSDSLLADAEWDAALDDPPAPDELFDADAFLRESAEGARPLLAALMQTQHFAVFAHQRWTTHARLRRHPRMLEAATRAAEMATGAAATAATANGTNSTAAGAKGTVHSGGGSAAEAAAAVVAAGVVRCTIQVGLLPSLVPADPCMPAPRLLAHVPLPRPHWPLHCVDAEVLFFDECLAAKHNRSGLHAFSQVSTPFTADPRFAARSAFVCRRAEGDDGSEVFGRPRSGFDSTTAAAIGTGSCSATGNATSDTRVCNDSNMISNNSSVAFKHPLAACSDTALAWLRFPLQCFASAPSSSPFHSHSSTAASMAPLLAPLPASAQHLARRSFAFAAQTQRSLQAQMRVAAVQTRDDSTDAHSARHCDADIHAKSNCIPSAPLALVFNWREFAARLVCAQSAVRMHRARRRLLLCRAAISHAADLGRHCLVARRAADEFAAHRRAVIVAQSHAECVHHSHAWRSIRIGVVSVQSVARQLRAVAAFARLRWAARVVGRRYRALRLMRFVQSETRRRLAGTWVTRGNHRTKQLRMF